MEITAEFTWFIVVGMSVIGGLVGWMLAAVNYPRK